MRKLVIVEICVLMVFLTAMAFGALGYVFQNDLSNGSFWSNVLANLLGAYAGFRFAFSASDWQKRVENDARRIDLYKTLLAILNRNKGHLADMKKYFQPPYDAPSFLCDVVSLDALVPLRCELLADCGTRKLIDHVHFELSHANRRVELTMFKRDPTIVTGTLTLIASTEGACQSAIEAISQRLAPLANKMAAQ